MATFDDQLKAKIIADLGPNFKVKTDHPALSEIADLLKADPQFREFAAKEGYDKTYHRDVPAYEKTYTQYDRTRTGHDIYEFKLDDFKLQNDLLKIKDKYGL